MTPETPFPFHLLGVTTLAQPGYGLLHHQAAQEHGHRQKDLLANGWAMKAPTLRVDGLSLGFHSLGIQRIANDEPVAKQRAPNC